MNKKYQRLTAMLLLIGLTFVLAGCVKYTADGTPTGWVFDYLGRPASQFLDFLAQFFGGSYGMAIIIVTIITRLFMLPASLKMTKTSMISQTRMKIAQPEIDEIKAELEAATDPKEKAALNAELMAVYKKYDIDMFGGVSGCLPLLIQMPIISAVYAAIRSSEQINSASFLGIHLGERSILLVVIVVAVTAFQGWLMQHNMPKSDNPTAQSTSRTMMLINPIMLGWFSWISNAGLGLYFATGGVFMIFQQLYTNRVVRPKIQEMLDNESTNKAQVKRQPRVKTTPIATSQSDRLVPTKNPIKPNNSNGTRRNAGKQKQR